MNYRVAEQGPELLDVNGKHFLMMGNQRGQVMPLSGASPQQPIIVNIQMPHGATRETGNQFGNAAGRRIQTAMRRNG